MSKQTFEAFEKALLAIYPNAEVFVTDSEPPRFGAYFGIEVDTAPKSKCCGADYRWLTCDECEQSNEAHDFATCSECGADIDD